MRARSWVTASSPTATRMGVGLRTGGVLRAVSTRRGRVRVADSAESSSAAPSRAVKDTEARPE